MSTTPTTLRQPTPALAPSGVQVVLTDGGLLNVAVVYGGPDRSGGHIWYIATPLPPGAGIVELRAACLPPGAGIRLPVRVPAEAAG